MQETGRLFINFSRLSRKLWDVRKSLLSSIPVLLQYGKVKASDAESWSQTLKKLSGKIFAEGLTFSLGKIVAVMGPQGSGKSAFLNTILNLDQDSSLPAYHEGIERLPILILHKDKFNLFRELTKGEEKCGENPQVLYVNMDTHGDVREGIECKTYEEAREFALKEQEDAGWLIWFVDDELLRDYSIFLSPTLQSSRLWLNEVMQSMIDIVHSIVMVIKVNESEKYREFIEKFLAYKNIVFVLNKAECEGVKEKISISNEMYFLCFSENNGHGDLRQKLEGILETFEDDTEINSQQLENTLIKTQEVRGEIEKALREVGVEDIERLRSEPVVYKFDEYIERVHKDFKGILERLVNEKRFRIRLHSELLNILKSVTKVKSVYKWFSLGEKSKAILLVAFIVGLFIAFYLKIVSEIPFSKFLLILFFALAIGVLPILGGTREIKYIDFSEKDIIADFRTQLDTLLKDLLDSLHRKMESYAIKNLGNPKDIETFLKLEWPGIIIYSHLSNNPKEFIGKLLRKVGTDEQIQEVFEKHNELADMLNAGRLLSESIIEEVFKRNIDIFITGLEAQINDIINMFLFEDINPLIAQQKLSSFLFESMDIYEKKVHEALKEELDEVKNRYLRLYHRFIGMDRLVAHPLLLHESLARALVELDEAIDTLANIL